MFFKQKILNQRNVILQKTLHNQAVAITASLVSFPIQQFLVLFPGIHNI